MSLRLRLFLLLGALVALLVAAQGWWVRTLARDLSAEVGELALSVGSSMATAVGGGDLVLEERRVIEDEVGQHHVSIIRRMRSTPAVAGELRPAPIVEGKLAPEGEAEWTREATVRQEYRYELRPLEGSADGLGAEIEERTPEPEQDVTVVFLRKGDAKVEPSLLVRGAGLSRAIPIPERSLGHRVERFARRLQLGSLGLLGVGLLLAAAVAHRVSAPLRQLGAAARRVGEGELGTQAPEPADREVAFAVRSFNHMSSELERLDREAKAVDAQRHLAELGEVARGLAHTLRNPLNALGLTIEELASRAGREGDDPEAARHEAAELAEAARRQIGRIDASIRSLLLLAAEGASADAMVEPVDLARLVDDVVLEAIQDSRRGVRIVVEAVDEQGSAEPGPGRVADQTVAGQPEEPSVLGVKAELRAVLQAVIVNAVEASPEGGQVRVRLAAVAAADDRARGVVEVLDEGPGLAPEVRARLFSPHLTTKPEGSGMGLFLSHRIVTDRYGGRLALEPRAGGGTRARVELADRQPPPAEPTTGPPAARPATATGEEAGDG